MAAVLIGMVVYSQQSARGAVAARARAERLLAQTRHDLVAAYLRAGDTNAALTTARTANAEAPGSATTRHDLAAASQAAADRQRAVGNRTAAISLYHDALTQFDAVTQMNTRDLSAQRDLLGAARHLADCEAEDGNIPDALAHYRRALQTAQGLAAAGDNQVKQDASAISQKISEMTKPSGQ
jgi:tetratricopeptide (TPR) repeat protein